MLVDAFVGAQVPRHLVTAEALADLARVAGLAAVNVVDARPLGGAARDRGRAAGGVPARDRARRRAGVLGKRRGGNVVARRRRARSRRWSACGRARRPTARRARCSGPEEIDAFIGGAPPWHDPD